MATVPGGVFDTSALPSDVGTLVGNAIQTQNSGGSFSTLTQTSTTVSSGTSILTPSTVAGSYDLATVSVSGSGATLGVSSGVELVNLQGTGSANVAIGADKSTVVLGNTGTSNLVFSGASNVTVAAGTGGGIIGNSASNGGNMVVGLGSANDTVVGSNLTVTGGSGNALIGTFSGTNSITAGNGAATVIGGGTTDVITGGNGNGQILSAGTSKTATITAGTGSTYLFGGTGTSVLQGNGGNDTIFAGSGSQTISGGGGADIFAFTSSVGNGGKSVVSDFSLAQGDRLSIQGFGGLTAAQVIANSTVVNGNTVITLTNNGTTTTITLTGVTNLSTSFFV